MTTLYDTQTICNKQGYLLCLTLDKALEEQKKAREDGDEMGVKMLQVAIDMIIEQVEPIEE